MKPLYGVLEAGNYWFKTYYTYYIEKLNIRELTYNPYLLFTRTNRFSVIGLQIDNTLFFSNKTFIFSKEKELEKANFTAKSKEKLGPNSPLKFNKGDI